jgi:hypothetical protein
VLSDVAVLLLTGTLTLVSTGLPLAPPTRPASLAEAGTVLVLAAPAGVGALGMSGMTMRWRSAGRRSIARTPSLRTSHPLMCRTAARRNATTEPARRGSPRLAQPCSQLAPPAWSPLLVHSHEEPTPMRGSRSLLATR